MPTAQVNLIKGDKVSIETDYRDALPINMYGVVRDILDSPGYMLCYPGLSLHTTGEGKDRAGVYNDRIATHFRVSGQKFISVDAFGVTTDLGDIPGTLQSAMPYSFNTQCIVADRKIFLYDATTGFRQVTDPFGGAIDGIWVDNYYFFTDGEDLYHTDILDEDTIDLSSFETAEFMPDKSLGLAKTQDNKVMVFGRNTIEYFINAATAGFAFQRVATRAQKIGIVATHAKCEAGGKYYITGGRKEEALGIYVIGIGSAEKVSSREIDKILSKYAEPDLSDMRMESRTEGDVTFILVHLPNETLCFNETVAKKFGVNIAWSILKSDVLGNTPYRGINGIFQANLGKWIFGDKQNTNIGILDNTVFTHYGDMVEWLLYTPFLNLKGKSIDEIEIETIPGHTVSSDASVFISLTYDGLTYGKEWSEIYGSPLGYGKRFIIRRLGYVSDYAGIKLRGATTSRMSFASVGITYG